jgi:ribose transport system substrate-binding protein
MQPGKYQFWTVGTVLASVGLLSACGGSGATSPTAFNNASVKITMVRVTGDPFYKTLECAATVEARRLGVSFTVTGTPNYEVSSQTTVLDAVIATHPNVIMTAPVDPTGVIPVFQAVKTAGIKMVTFDTTLNDAALVNSQVVTNNTQQGTYAADALAKAIGNTGLVFTLADMPGVTTTGQEVQGFNAEIAKTSQIQNLGTQYDNNDQNKAVSLVNSVLSAHPNLAGIFTTNTFASQAAATALQERHIAPGTVKIIAYDTTQQILDGLKAGVYAAVIAYQARNEGVDAVDAALRLAKGESVPHQYLVGNAVLTQANVDQLGSQYVYVTAC